MNYLLTLRHDDIPSELINGATNHEIAEIRAWVTITPTNRWVEVECLCGAVSREGGAGDYLSLVRGAWGALCGATEPVSA